MNLGVFSELQQKVLQLPFLQETGRCYIEYPNRKVAEFRKTISVGTSGMTGQNAK